MWKTRIAEYLRFCKQFGLLGGTALFYKTNVSCSKGIKVPGVSNNIHLRKGTSDYDVFCQVFLHDQYNFKFPMHPRTIIDAGANIGMASIQFKSRFPNARIIAIEPDEANFNQLARNLKPYNDVYLKACALWNNNTYLQINDKYNSGAWGMVTEACEKACDGLVPSITIPDILEEFSLDTVDILKIDIETAEKELFKDNYEVWMPKIKVIIIELHDKICKGTGMAFLKAVTNSLNHFSFYQIGENTVIVNEDLISKQTSHKPEKLIA